MTGHIVHHYQSTVASLQADEKLMTLYFPRILPVHSNYLLHAWLGNTDKLRMFTIT